MMCALNDKWMMVCDGKDSSITPLDAPVTNFFESYMSENTAQIRNLDQ